MKPMKKIKVSLVVGFVLLACCGSAQAETKVPGLIARVVDQADLLSAGDTTRVEDALRRFERKTAGQMAILISRVWKTRALRNSRSGL